MRLSEKSKFYIRKGMACITKPLYIKKRSRIFAEQRKKGLNNIPVFIISFNRLSYVENFIKQLEKYNLTNIHIIDNGSTYPPLLEYYESCPYDVIYMNENGGHKVFWNSPRFDEYRKDFYIVSDPDLEFVDGCPMDVVEYMFDRLYKYPFVRKIGLSLKIDNLPDNTCLVDEAMALEKSYYDTYIKKDNLYYAGIDTTFALYVPDQLVNKQKFLAAFRTGEPYQMRHLPWYKEPDDITKEDIFYSNNKINGWYDPVKGYKPDDFSSND